MLRVSCNLCSEIFPSALLIKEVLKLLDDYHYNGDHPDNVLSGALNNLDYFKQVKEIQNIHRLRCSYTHARSQNKISIRLHRQISSSCSFRSIVSFEVPAIRMMKAMFTNVHS
jgi:hypothetical protein